MQTIYSPNKDLPDEYPAKRLFYVDSSDSSLECGFYETESQAEHAVLMIDMVDFICNRSNDDPRLRAELEPFFKKLRSLGEKFGNGE